MAAGVGLFDLAGRRALFDLAEKRSSVRGYGRSGGASDAFEGRALRVDVPAENAGRCGRLAGARAFLASAAPNFASRLVPCADGGMVASP